MDKKTIEKVPAQDKQQQCIIRLTDRDRHLMALLAVARYLSEPQLSRVMFGGRQEAARKRLADLAGDETGTALAYVRRLIYRTYEGRRAYVWTLSEAGYCIADRLLAVKRPLSEVGIDFLEHTIMLNELLVRMLTASLPPPNAGRKFGSKVPKIARPAFSRIPDARFRWVSSDSARLPWTEYRPGLKAKQRVIHPDAVLELGTARRIFVECETGTHSVVAESDEKGGSTVAKVERYDAFLSGFADVPSKLTFYAQAYPDRLAPEVLFLVSTASRANSINTAIAKWRREGPNRKSVLEAQTIDVATRELTKAIGVNLPEPAKSPVLVSEPVALSSEDIDVIRRFYVGTRTRFKEMREVARAQKGPLPEYPPETSELGAVLVRLGALRARSP